MDIDRETLPEEHTWHCSNISTEWRAPEIGLLAIPIAILNSFLLESLRK